MQIFLVAMVLLMVDQVGKFIFPTMLNEGGALGIVPSPGGAGAAMVQLSLMIVGVLWSLHTKIPWWAIGLFVGGCASNLFDRVLVGGGEDYIPLPGIPVITNLADVAIVFVWLPVVIFFEFKKKEVINYA